MSGEAMKLLVLPGDGIGPEIVSVATDALEALDRRFGMGLELIAHDIGFASLEKTGTTLTSEVMTLATRVDGVLLGPAATEEYPPREQGGINPSAWCRTNLDLYANIRPSYVRPGVPAHLREMDLVIVRENTEGFYADRNMAVGVGEFMPTPEVALAVGKLTVQGCRRIAVTAFELARRRRRHVTAVHKANVLRIYSGLFLRQVEEVAKDYPDVAWDTVIVDAMAAMLVRAPERYDVIVTTNMFGDILSDCAAMLTGSLGMLPSASLGEADESGRRAALYEPVHGSAPDIAGKGVANPLATILSFSMMLRYSFDMDDDADMIDQAVKNVLDAGLRTPDIMQPGKTKVSTTAMGEAITKELDELAA
jgi:3-isopropylmalate dehydrogenase